MGRIRRSFDATTQARYQRSEQHHSTERASKRTAVPADAALTALLAEVQAPRVAPQSSASYSGLRSAQARVTATILASMMVGAAMAQGMEAPATLLPQPRIVPARRLAEWAPIVQARPAPAPAPGPVFAERTPDRAPSQVLDLTHSAYDFAPLQTLLGPRSNNATFALSGDDVFAVYGIAAQNGTAQVKSSNLYGDDRVAESTLLSFVKNVDTAFTAAGAVGLPLRRIHTPTQGARPRTEMYTFQKLYRTEKGTVVELQDPQGAAVTFSLKQLLAQFPGGLSRILLAASEPNLDGGNTLLTVAMEDHTLALGVSQVSALASWFNNHTTPSIAYSNQGHPYFAQPVFNHAPGSAPAPAPTPISAQEAFLAAIGKEPFSVDVQEIPLPAAFHVRLVKAHDADDERVISHQEFAQHYRYLDPAVSGAGTAFVAHQDALPLQAGSTYLLERLAWNQNELMVHMEAPSQETLAVPHTAFVEAFGETGISALLANSLQEPFLDEATYRAPPINAKLFDDAPANVGPHLVRQGQVGDCYFDAAVAAILVQDKPFARSLVRPSANGVPHNLDVRMYDPELRSTTPHTLVVTDKLPTSHSASIADGMVVTPMGVPQMGVPILEKAYVRANQLLGWHSQDASYYGIAGGWPAKAMQMLTGRPATQHDITENMTDAALWGHLSQVRHGKLVALTTPLFLNTPGEFGAPGIVAKHAYTVTAAHNGGSLANHTVGVRNPWGMTEPDGRGGINPGGDGEFNLRLPQVRAAYRTISVGSTPEVTP